MNAPTAITDAAARPTLPLRLAAAWNSDVGWSFRHSPVAIVSAIVLGLCLAAALFAPWVAPHNPFDLRR
jgi:peptide/nickel transport system permease protein